VGVAATVHRVFVDFLYELRARRVPVGTMEALALARALRAGLHDSSLDGFYFVARSLLVHTEAHLDAFDEAFLKHFRGIEKEGQALGDELREWLRDAIDRRRELSDEERAFLDSLDPDALFDMLEERLREQKKRHDGGDRWVGTGGTSPFGHSGSASQGVRIGGSGGNRSAIAVANARNYRPYRSDLALDVRQMGLALRKLRTFAREGAEEELDLEGTIAETARNAGELEIVTRPPRRPDTRVILLMDVGGSMDPYAHLVSRLFSAAKKATHFRELRTYYFHNCVYGRVWETERFEDPLRVRDLLHECGPHYKLIMVGDALMAPYELFSPGGFRDASARGDDTIEGVVWLAMLRDHFHRSVWLNPEPRRLWMGNTIETIAGVFPMFELTLDGLGRAMQHLVRGGRSPGPRAVP